VNQVEDEDHDIGAVPDQNQDHIQERELTDSLLRPLPSFSASLAAPLPLSSATSSNPPLQELLDRLYALQIAPAPAPALAPAFSIKNREEPKEILGALHAHARARAQDSKPKVNSGSGLNSTSGVGVGMEHKVGRSKLRELGL
jgi:hypothetical protein